MVAETKVCTYCKKPLPLSAFKESKRNPDGLAKICIKCNEAYYEKLKNRKDGKDGKAAPSAKKIKENKVIEEAQSRPKNLRSEKLVLSPEDLEAEKKCLQKYKITNVERFADIPKGFWMLECDITYQLFRAVEYFIIKYDYEPTNIYHCQGKYYLETRLVIHETQRF